MKPKLHELTDRWAALLLVLVIVFWLFAGPLSQKADAVVVSSVIVGAVIATMALAGITFVASGMTAAQLQDWVSDKLNDWAADVGSPLDHLINSAGIGVTISGLLTVGTAAAQGISQFIDWLKTELGLQNNDTQNVVNVQGAVSLPIFTSYENSTMLYMADDANYSTYLASNQSITFAAYAQDFGALILVSNQSFTVYYHSYYKHGPRWDNYTKTPNHTSLYYLISIYTSYSNLKVSVPIYDTFQNLIADYNNMVNSDSESLAINTGVITIPQVQNDDKVFVDVGALPGSTVTEVTDGVISDALTGTLDVSGEVAEEEPEYVIDGPEPVYGLADVFPFCIPFDLYDFVSCLAADPVAPHFEWRLYVEDLVDYTFVIDLQQFETVAQIFRTMFLLAFIIGLAMVTRHLLRS